MENVRKVFRIKDNLKSLTAKFIENENILNELKEFPVVYIHVWKFNGKYRLYVGETNNIKKRTQQHYEIGKYKPKSWQSNINKCNAYLYIICHEHFNKSLTLDVENKLIHYLCSVPSIDRVFNGRGNPQGKYYTAIEFKNIFNRIWLELGEYNKELFPSEDKIKSSALFKASPLHELNSEQLKAQTLIIEKVVKTLLTNKKGQLIFVEGEAGTGKTVLCASTFYNIFCNYENIVELLQNKIKKDRLKCYFLVNHNEQLKVYKQIMTKLGIENAYEKIVYKPTSFINTFNESELVDVVFVDEAHLLLTQGKMAYRGKNQLKDILNRSRVVVTMFDKKQILTIEEYIEDKNIKKLRSKAKHLNNYVKLTKQLRMNIDEESLNWLNDFIDNGIIKKIPKNKYEIKIFDNPFSLEDAIKEKASTKKNSLSRLIATYDWPYNEKRKPKIGEFWEVKIGNWHKPWNRELLKKMSKEEQKEISQLTWVEQPQTIDEVGSTFTVHGFDLSYAGVIIGPSVKYENGRIIFDPSLSCNYKATQWRTMENGIKKNFATELLKNELNVLMKRGVNGLYIYACDEKLRNKLLECAK